MKSKTTAYLLWFFLGFLGFLGANKFYLGKTGWGIACILTVNFLGILWVVDAFTLGKQVDEYNMTHKI